MNKINPADHIGLARKFAMPYVPKRMRHYIEQTEEFQEACKGLCVAAQKFDPTLGYAFGTYAGYWCRHFIMRSIGTNRHRNQGVKYHQQPPQFSQCRDTRGGWGHEGDIAALDTRLEREKGDVLDAVCERERWRGESPEGRLVADAMSRLTEREKYIVRRVKMEGATLRVVAKEMGISVERVRQLSDDGLRRLARYFVRKGIYTHEELSKALYGNREHA